MVTIKTSPLLAKIAQVSAIIEHLKDGKIYTILVLACCILRCRSCCLNHCKVEHECVSGEKAKLTTVYGRFKRVFQTGKGAKVHKTVFVLILHLVYPFISPYLIVDRTEFTIGDRWVNLLVFGVVCKGVLIPLVWQDLGERKSSSQKERLILLDKLLAWWKASGLPRPTLSLLGDREFIGQTWLMALQRRDLTFVIRLKTNLRFKVWYKGDLKDRTIRLKVLEKYMHKKGLNHMEIVILDELILNFVVIPNDDTNAKEPFIYLITNLDNLSIVATLYRKRWQIECCFKHLKSNGFDLEKTALEGAHKQEILFSILAVTYVLAIMEGILNDYDNTVKQRTFSNGKTYKEKSLFVFGFEILKPKVDNMKLLLRHLKQLLVFCLKQFKYPYFYYT